MELTDAIARRRMVREFTDAPVSSDVLDGLCDLARRAPSAGNSQALEFLVLDTPHAVARYWDTTLPEARRATFRWPGLVVAPALVLVATRPATYLERYTEPDKGATGLGDDEGAWAVPYWWVDAGAAIEHLLLGAVDAGLGACLFGLFDHEQAVAREFGVPTDRRLVATIAVGQPLPDAPAGEVRGRSAHRPRPPLGGLIHRGSW